MKFVLGITFTLASAVWATPTTSNFSLSWVSQTRMRISSEREDSRPTTTTLTTRKEVTSNSEGREICVGQTFGSRPDLAVCARAHRRPRGDLPRVAKRKTALVVDDEPAVRRLVRAILRRQGYEILEADNGLVAYELLQRISGGIQLLITDVEMPRMDGLALGQKVADEYPSVQVLYMSGFVSDAPKHQIPSHQFLQKPFSPDVLVQRLQSLGA